MIKKLRRKVTGLSVLFVGVLLMAVLLSLFFSARNNIAQRSSEELREALQNGVQYAKTPCFIAELLPSGTVRVAGSNYYDLDDHETLSEAVEAAINSGMQQGVLRQQDLRFYRQDGLLTVRIAFMDSSFELSTLRSLALAGVGLFAVAMAVVAALGWLLAGYITRPVAQAWARERQFLSDAGHELKTPLTVILSSSSALEELANSDYQPYVDNIQSESRRMKSLLEDMLTLWRTEESTLQRTAVSLSDLVAEAVFRFEPVAFEAGHALHYDIENGLNISGEHDSLYRLISILLDNAVKYAAPSTPIRLTMDRVGKQVVLTIENQGNQIPAEKLPHLFDRFYRADESRGESAGFGLGLAIAREIVQKHDGTIAVHSDEQTTAFIVTIPLS